MSRIRGLLALVCLLIGIVGPKGDCYAQDLTNLGGALSTDLPGRAALQVPASNIVSEERRQLQLTGFTVFHRTVTRGEGLGPRFVNRSCGACHVQNGRGSVSFKSGHFDGSPMVVKLALSKLAADGSPRAVPGLGLQLLNHSVSRRDEIKVDLFWREIPGRYPDGRSYSLRRPDLRFNSKGYSQRNIRNSLRMSPILIGVGLVESIPESAILERNDPLDANGDGISGRPNYVPDLGTGLTVIGRFGFKASQPTVAQQSAAALFNDMGVTTELFPREGTATELSNDDLNRLALYQKIACVPRARNQTDAKVVAGRELFVSLGCENCHRMNFTTQSAIDPELDAQEIHPFSDFLLHDMGRDLADKRPEFQAQGTEWRTTPLWGLGFSNSVSNVQSRYLHDGRARTIEEAILWHGGEAAQSRNAFKLLSKSNRSLLLAFLKSL